MHGFKVVQRLIIAVAMVVIVALLQFGLPWGEGSALADNTGLGFRDYVVEMKHQQGRVYLSIDGTTGSIGDYDWVTLYDHKPQEAGQPRGFDPNHLEYFYISTTSSQLMSTSWRSGLYAIYSSYDYKKGKYVTLAQTGPSGRF